ncbi:hypothetical protein SK128_020362 [Halocaridina rubra]|uniref:Uncharacterized protein n=1 Tax=Halocaridina rubra TaxID=373956 RepID=A0AAN8XER1_HALRR
MSSDRTSNAWHMFNNSIIHQTNVGSMWRHINTVVKNKTQSAFVTAQLSMLKILLTPGLISVVSPTFLHIYKKLSPIRKCIVLFACLLLCWGQMRRTMYLLPKALLRRATAGGKITTPDDDGITFLVLHRLLRVLGDPLLKLINLSPTQAVGSADCAIFLPSIEPLPGGWVGRHLPNSSSSTSRELHGLLDAISLLLRTRSNCLVILDLQSALCALSPQARNPNLVSRILRQLATAFKYSLAVHFLWILSHISILANDTVNLLAKTACGLPLPVVDP